MNKRFILSVFFNLIYGVISIGINFMIVPFVVEKLGSEAYGFNSISDNFVTYATIITTALNYMGCRFIALAYHKKQKKEAEYYFSSLFYGDAILATGLLLISVIVVYNLQYIIDIPTELLFDVKITFLITFVSFIIQIMFTAFNTGVYVRDRMDLYGIRNIAYSCIRVISIIVCFLFWEPRLYYISLASFIGTIFGALFDAISTRKLVPDICISRDSFRKSYIVNLVSAGGWFSFVSLGGVLSSGLDLLITNQMIDSYNMGILAVSKTLPLALNSIKNVITNIFRPKMVRSYAVDSIDDFVVKTKMYMRLIYLLLIVPLAGITVFMCDFYRLWLPTYNDDEIKLVTVLTFFSMASIVANTLVVCIPEIFAIINQLKFASFVNVFENFLSIALTLILLVITDKGVIIVASISAIINIVYQMTFGITYVPKLIGQGKWCFCMTVVRGMIAYVCTSLFFAIFKSFANIDTWRSFVIEIFIFGIFGYIVSYFILIKRNERREIYRYIGNLRERRHLS